MTTALACHFHSMIYVPLYDTLGEPAIIHIINQSRSINKCSIINLFVSSFSLLASLKTVFVDKPENVLVILKLAKQVPTLRRLVLTKKIPSDKDAEIRSQAKDLNIEVMTFNDLRVNFR